MSQDIVGLSYEMALHELDEIIERLERGAVALDDAITAYERGAALASHCAQLLDRTEQKVSQLVIGGGGVATEKPLDPVAEPPASSRSAMPVAARPSIVRDRLPIDPDEIPF